MATTAALAREKLVFIWAVQVFSNYVWKTIGGRFQFIWMVLSECIQISFAKKWASGD